MAPYVVLMGIGPLVALSINYHGKAARRIPWAVGAVAVNVAIDLALLREIGIVAAGIGTSVAYALYVGGHLLICRSELGLHLRPIAVTVVRVVVASGAMAGVLALLGTEDLSVAEWIAGVVLGPAVFAAALLLTREFRVAGARELLARVRA